MLHTPVVLIIFKRPELTARALDAIRAVRPRVLFVVADGPRPDHPGEADACAAARDVIERVDWPCEVIRRYSDVNLGCGLRPGTGITSAFDLFEEVIVLEDDCVPLPGFFRFCEELLQRYRDDGRVMHIGGTSLRRRPLPIADSYYFSRFNVAAGSFATWRRAWRYFDPAVQQWPSLRPTSWLKDIVGTRDAVDHWAEAFDRAFMTGGNVSFWDHQWTFACWAHGGLSILPRTNLASNIGAGADATHMVDADDPILNVPVAEVEFPLRHPSAVSVRTDLDRAFLREVVLPRLRPLPAWRLALSRALPPAVRRGLRHAAEMARAALMHTT